MKKNGDFSGEGSGLQFASLSWIEGQRQPCVSRYADDGDSPSWESVPVTADVRAELEARGLQLISYDKATAEILGIPRAQFVDGKMVLIEPAAAVTAKSAVATPAPSAPPATVAASARTIAEIEHDSAQVAANAARKQAEQAEALRICQAAKAHENWKRIAAKHGGKLRAASDPDKRRTGLWAHTLEKFTPA